MEAVEALIYKGFWCSMVPFALKSESLFLKNTVSLLNLVTFLLNLSGGLQYRSCGLCDAAYFEGIRQIFDFAHAGTVNKDGTSSFVEDSAGKLMDSACESNRGFMKAGMKLGAGFVFQLMGM